jgi:hypothetical protein
MPSGQTPETEPARRRETAHGPENCWSVHMTFARRIAPALLLIVLAPLVAEFLLGDFTVSSLPLLLVLGWQYGGGALLIREVARHTRRGWPTIVLLAIAYALIEEGFTTQSLFNPNYVGKHLLEFGYIPTLGTSLNWCVYVVGIHVVWSIGTPILIAEGVVANRRATPWLHRTGLALTSAAFILGCALTTFFTLMSDPFVAAPAQLVVTGMLVIALVTAAFVIRKDFPRPRLEVQAPAPWIAGCCALVLASAFVSIPRLPAPPTPAWLSLVALLACVVVASLLIVRWSAAAAWGPIHYLALATATVLTYGWRSLAAFGAGSTNLGAPVDGVDIVGQCVLIVAILGLIGWGVRRNLAEQREASAPTAGYPHRVSAT